MTDSPYRITVLERRLADVLRPVAYRPVEMAVQYHDGPVIKTDSEQVARYFRPVDSLNPYRGAGAIHWRCPLCGEICWAYGDTTGVLASKVQDQHFSFWGSTAQFPIIDKHFMSSMSLREKFPYLRTRPVKVLAKRTSDQVLPGDPDWTGQFVTPLNSRDDYDRFIEREFGMAPGTWGTTPLPWSTEDPEKS